jgi:hypothetical protein
VRAGHKAALYRSQGTSSSIGAPIGAQSSSLPATAAMNRCSAACRDAYAPRKRCQTGREERVSVVPWPHCVSGPYGASGWRPTNRPSSSSASPQTDRRCATWLRREDANLGRLKRAVRLQRACAADIPMQARSIAVAPRRARTVKLQCILSIHWRGLSVVWTA